MKTAEQRYEQIEEYLRGQLPPGEVAAFEAEMSTDPSLAALVQQHRLERQGLELLIERDLFAKMQGWDREMAFQQPVATPRRGVMRPLTILIRAAAVLLLAALGWWLIRENSTSVPDATPPLVQTKPKNRPRTPTIHRPAPAKPSGSPVQPTENEESGTGFAQQQPQTIPQQTVTPAPVDELPEASSADYAALASEFYQDRDFIPPAGSKGGSASPSYNRALDNFRDGKYTDAVSQLQPSGNTGTDALLQKELMAHSLYKSGRYDDAIIQFREIIAAHQLPYSQRAEWAMVLTLLHQMPAKKPLLDRVLSGILANPQHPFYKQAKELQARLLTF